MKKAWGPEEGEGGLEGLVKDELTQHWDTFERDNGKALCRPCLVLAHSPRRSAESPTRCLPSAHLLSLLGLPLGMGEHTQLCSESSPDGLK